LSGDWGENDSGTTTVPLRDLDRRGFRKEKLKGTEWAVPAKMALLATQKRYVPGWADEARAIT